MKKRKTAKRIFANLNELYLNTNYTDIFLQELQELIEFFTQRIFELYLNTNYTDVFLQELQEFIELRVLL